MKQKKNIPKLLMVMFLTLLIVVFANPSEVNALQPSTPRGFSTVQRHPEIVQYNIPGHTFMIHGVTTMLSRNDDGYLYYQNNATKYNHVYEVYTSGGERRVRGTVNISYFGGGTGYTSYRIRLTPNNFSSLSIVPGRSFVDNLYAEAQVSKERLDGNLGNGGSGWLNPIIIVRNGNSTGSHRSWPVMSTGRTFSNVDNAFTHKSRVYFRKSKAKAAPIYGWGAATQQTLDNLFDIRVNLPSIDDDPPVVSFGPVGRDTWQSTNANVKISVEDPGTGVNRYRTRVYANGNWGSWSSWRRGNEREITLSAQGRNRIEVQAEDNAGNSSRTLSGYYRIDKTTPRANSPVVSNVRYTNGNDHWVRPGDTFNVRTSAFDDQSRVVRHYLRLFGDGNDNRAHHDRPTSDTHMNEFRTTGGFTNIISGIMDRQAWTSRHMFTARANTNSDGKRFEIQSYFRDSAGNHSGSYVQSGQYIRVDGTAPTMSANPNNRGWSSNNASVVLTHNDDAGGSGVATQQYAWSTSTETPSSWSTYRNPVSQSKDGIWYLHTRITDNVGNTRTQRFGPYRVDKTAPTGSIVGNPSHWSNQNVTLTINTSDSHSGVRRIRRPNGTWVNSSSASHTVSSNGTYTFRIEDVAGNTRDVSATVNRIDKTTPSYTSSNVYDARYVNGNDHWFRPGDSFRVRTVGNDSSSRIRYNYLRLFGDGNDNRAQHDWNGSSASAVNEFSNGNYTEITSGSRGTYNTTAQYTFNGRVLPNVGNRTFNVQYYFRDNAGNNNGYHNTGYRIRTDATAPSITANVSGRGWDNTNATVSLTHSDGESGIATRQYAWSTSTSTPSSWSSYSSPVTQTSNGVWYLHARAVDNVGYVTTERFGPYRIDKTRPNGSISGNPTSWTNQDVTLSFNATDSGGSGVRRVRRPNGTWVNGSSTTFTVGSNGTYTFRVEDHAGNIRDVSAVVNRIDKTRPDGSISGNPTNWTNKDVTLNFTGTDSGGSGVRRVRRPNGTWVNGASASQTVSSNGTYTFRVEDHAGNVRDISTTVNRIDKIQPNGVITGNPTSWTNQNATLSFNATDSGGSGVRRVRTPGGTWVNGSSVNFTVTSNGTYTFRVEDHAGNIRDVSVTVNRIDKTQPNGTISGNPTNWTNQDVTLSFNATDSGGAGIRRVRRPDGTWVNGSSTTFTVGSNGTYTFRAQDHAGNIRDVSVTVNRIDKVRPEGVISGNPTNWTNQNVTLSFNASDGGGSGVRRVRRPNGTWVNGAFATQVVKSNGSYTFIVEDHAGNRRDVTVNVTRIDKQTPGESMIEIPK